MPRATTTKQKVNPVKVEKIHHFIDEINEDAHQRKEEMKARIKQISENCVEKMCQELYNEFEDMLDLKISEFLALPIKPKREPLSSGDAVPVEADHEAIANMQQPEIHTAMRPKNVRGLRTLNLQTPSGKMMHVPSLITPRVGDGGSNLMMTTRPIRRDEVTFSAAGSPVVLDPDVVQEAAALNVDALYSLLNEDSSSQSPITRDFAEQMRQYVIHKKNAQQRENSSEV